MRALRPVHIPSQNLNVARAVLGPPSIRQPVLRVLSKFQPEVLHSLARVLLELGARTTNIGVSAKDHGQLAGVVGTHEGQRGEVGEVARVDEAVRGQTEALADLRLGDHAAADVESGEILGFSGWADDIGRAGLESGRRSAIDLLVISLISDFCDPVYQKSLTKLCPKILGSFA